MNRAKKKSKVQMETPRSIVAVKCVNKKVPLSRVMDFVMDADLMQKSM